MDFLPKLSLKDFESSIEQKRKDSVMKKHLCLLVMKLSSGLRLKEFYIENLNMTEARASPGYLVKNKYNVDNKSSLQIHQYVESDKYKTNCSSPPYLSVIEGGLYTPQKTNYSQN